MISENSNDISSKLLLVLIYKQKMKAQKLEFILKNIFPDCIRIVAVSP